MTSAPSISASLPVLPVLPVSIVVNPPPPQMGTASSEPHAAGTTEGAEATVQDHSHTTARLESADALSSFSRPRVAVVLAPGGLPSAPICAAGSDDVDTGTRFPAGAGVMACTAVELAAQAAEIARVGDILLFDRSQAVADSFAWKCLRWGIARAQSRMLSDYGFCRDNVADGSRFVHAALLGAAGQFAEMDRQAQVRGLDTVPVGTVIRIRRPRTMSGTDARANDGVGAWLSALADVDNAVSYPTGELAMYYGWSWQLNKLWLGRKFCDVFRTDRANTCAAAAIQWWQLQGGWFSSDRAEAWYPGRVAVSCALRTVAEVKIV